MRIRNLKVADFPFLGVEIIGAGADIIDEAEGKVLIGDDDIAARGVRGQDEGFMAQVTEGVVEGELHSRIFVARG